MQSKLNYKEKSFQIQIYSRDFPANVFNDCVGPFWSRHPAKALLVKDVESG
jgi:hypothetical protein